MSDLTILKPQHIPHYTNTQKVPNPDTVSNPGPKRVACPLEEYVPEKVQLTKSHNNITRLPCPCAKLGHCQLHPASEVLQRSKQPDGYEGSDCHFFGGLSDNQPV